MFKKFFRKATAAAPNRSNLQLGLTFLGFEQEDGGIMVGWRATGAPSDIMFDIDFLGHPSGVTTGFVWDTERDILNNVFIMQGDTSFSIKAGCAYAGNAMDGSGRVEKVWVLSEQSNRELKFENGHQVSVDFVFDPKQNTIRNPA